jgi:hypothetical protein
MKREAVIIFGFTLVVYLAVVVAVRHTQSHAIFQSRGASFAPPAHLDVSEAELVTPDGERLHAWWLQTRGAEKTILYCQPNSTTVSQHVSRLNTFRKMGVNGLLFDYRGYGKSTGRISSEQHIYTDGLTAWNYLTTEKRIDPEDIIVWGRSLGGGVAAEIARCKKTAALVLESTFFSLDEIVRRQYWFLPTTKLLKFHFQTGRKLKQVRAPVVIIHSVDDHFIPFDQADKLFASAGEPKFIIRTTGSHLDSFDNQGVTFGSQPVSTDDPGVTLSALMICLDL